jgi:hypothetical protein
MDYPMMIYREVPVAGIGTMFIDLVDDSCLSVALPVKLNVEFMPFKNKKLGFARHIGIGYAFGFYMSPDFGPFTGVYHGPQLSVMF